MPQFFNPKFRVEVTLSSDDSIPVESRPVFIFRKPTIGTILSIQSISTGGGDSTLNDLLEIMQTLFMGCSAFPDRPLKDLLTVEELSDLLAKYIENSCPSGDQQKKSDWQRDSLPAQSAPIVADAGDVSMCPPRQNPSGSNASGATAWGAISAAAGATT